MSINNYYTSVISILFLILIFQSSTESSKILGIFSGAGRSVNILYNRLMKGLADAGHDVTVVSPYRNKLSILNGSYTDVHLTGFAEEYEELLVRMDLLGTAEQSSISAVDKLSDFVFEGVRDTFTHPNVKNLLASNAKFDLLIVEHLWSESLLIFSHIYNCPAVVFTSLGGVNPWVNDMMGNHLPPSFVPHIFFLGDYSEGMTFLQRVHNFLFYAYDYKFKHYKSFPMHNELLQAHFKSPPDVATLYSNVSLLLLGSHISLRQSTPLLPNIVEIGGFHIDPPQKLPNDLQDFLDNAKVGAIYFSMGSHIKSSFFSGEKKQMLMNVFKRLNLAVLWKFEEEELPGKPQNVLIRKWMPQMDILGHPNTKLFIGHGGYGSTLETLHHGIPTLLIPAYGDQFNNANKAVQQGYALKLSYNDENFNEETLFAMIKELLENPKYTEGAKLRSRLFHDRPTKPLDTAIYWIEYVIRHKGADHLKVFGRKLPGYQYYSIDVISFLISIIVLGLCSVYFGLKAIFKACGISKNVKLKRS